MGGAGIVPAVTSIQTQNCQGSQCLQNNLAAGWRRRSTEGPSSTLRKSPGDARARTDKSSRNDQLHKRTLTRPKRFIASPIVRSLLTSDGFIDYVINKRY